MTTPNNLPRELKCPICNSTNLLTERRPDGDSRCLDCNYQAMHHNFLKAIEATTHKHTQIDPVMEELAAIRKCARQLMYDFGITSNPCYSNQDIIDGLNQIGKTRQVLDQSRPAEEVTDTMRLDWMIKNKAFIEESPNFKGVFLYTPKENTSRRWDSAREAIDVAMEAAKNGK